MYQNTKTIGLNIYSVHIYVCRNSNSVETPCLVLLERKKWEKIPTEPLNVRNNLTSSSSEIKGCLETRFKNLAKPRRLPSMNSLSDVDFNTVVNRAEGHLW